MKNLKIVIIGDSGVGKTAIRNQFIHNRFFSRSKQTIGADFQTIALDVTADTTDTTERVTLQIWDTAGQERFHSSLGHAFFRGCDVCVLVFDLTNAESLANTAKWQRMFVTLGNIENPSSFPFYLVGNKSDIHLDKRVITPDHGQSASQILFEIALDMEKETAEAPILQPPQLAKINLPTFLGSLSIKSRLKALEPKRSIEEMAESVELASFPSFVENSLARSALSPKASLLSFHAAPSSRLHSRQPSDDTASIELDDDSLSPYPYFEVSAKNGDSVRALFLHVATNVKPITYTTVSSTIQLDYETIDRGDRSSRSNCC